MNTCAITGNIAKKPSSIAGGKSIKLVVATPCGDVQEDGRECSSLVYCILMEPKEKQSKILLSDKAKGMYIDFTGRVSIIRYENEEGEAMEVMDVVIDKNSLLLREVA